MTLHMLKELDYANCEEWHLAQLIALVCTGLKPLVYSPEMIPGGLKRTHADTSQKECGSDPSICSHGLRSYIVRLYSLYIYI